MDSFDEKRGMVKKLLDMLKTSASGEVGTGLQKPEGADDMHGVQVERVEVLPEHKMDMPTPEHDVETKELNAGGVMPEPSDGQPDIRGAVESNLPPSEMKADEEDATGEDYPDEEEEPSSMFQSFLSRKKRK